MGWKAINQERKIEELKDKMKEWQEQEEIYIVKVSAARAVLNKLQRETEAEKDSLKERIRELEAQLDIFKGLVYVVNRERLKRQEDRFEYPFNVEADM